MFRFTIRDLLWLTVVVALVVALVALWLQYREATALREEVRTWQGGFDIVRNELAEVTGMSVDDISVFAPIYIDEPVRTRQLGELPVSQSPMSRR
jgi:hypothetical protein